MHRASIRAGMRRLQIFHRTMAFGLALFALSCGKRVPEPAGVPPGTPHVSWIIMHGDRDNPDAEFACQSTGPRECIIPASAAAERVFSDVHLYFHGAGGETTYRGTFRIDFLSEGAGPPRDVPTSITVRGEEKITNQSVTGIVTSSPGRYAVQIALQASMPGVVGSQSIREQIPVTISASR